MNTRKKWAYIIGVALGDGNLSNPNGRAIRLRITCDARYPRLANHISNSLKCLLPENRVSIVRVPQKNTYFNISVYSNLLAVWMPWHEGKGSKEIQCVRVPQWIRKNKVYSKECLRGLLQTDGSIYRDRGYLMVNFTNNVEVLSKDVYHMLQKLGYRPTITSTPVKHKLKHTVRIARDSDLLIEEIRLFKE